MKQAILLDNCIISVAHTMQPASLLHKFFFNGHWSEVRVLGAERVPLPSVGNWKRHEIECLPTVASILSGDQFRVLRYLGLLEEAMTRPGSASPVLMGNLLAGINWEFVDAAVERSNFFHLAGGKYLTGDASIEYCAWLLAAGMEEQVDLFSRRFNLPLGQQENLRNVQRFRELCQGLARSQFPDAFHLWTAEVAGASYFLTIDRRFINAMTQTKKINLPCRPISPSQFLDIVGVRERLPFKYVEGRVYDYSGREM